MTVGQIFTKIGLALLLKIYRYSCC